MNQYLLDVCVLVAILDPLHTLHQRAFPWFLEHAREGWATCPLTENGTVRIVSNPRYSNPQSPPSVPIEILRDLTAFGNHRFVPDDISVLNSDTFDSEGILTPKQITDTYLLALAVHNNLILATLDKHLVTTAVRLPNAKLHLI